MAKPTERYACDRCHGQKLRCIRGDGDKCIRCAKARATCIWGQSLRRRKATGAQKKREAALAASVEQMTVTPPSGLDSLPSTMGAYPNPPVEVFQQQVSPVTPPVMGLLQQPSSWPGVLMDPSYQAQPGDCSALFWDAAAPDSQAVAPWQPPEWTLSPQPQAVGSNVTPESLTDVADDDASDGSPLAMVRQLSELNVELYAHAATVPKPPASPSETVVWKDKDFAIDRTFQLSQKLIEILNLRQPEASSTDSECGSAIMPVEADQGSCLLILSCYSRLVGTYENIFGNMQACLDRSSATAQDRYAKLPDVKVGSFSLPSSSALRITLIMQLARNIFMRMGEAVKAAGLLSADEEMGLMPAAAKAVLHQETRLMGRISKLRNTLISLNVL